jgi:ABC-type transport system involved in cytochrome c biogenesis permease subunit
MPDCAALASDLETQLYLTHLFLILSTIASYAIFRSRWVGRLAWTLSGLALAGSITVRSLAAGRIPLANMYEFGLLLGVVLVVLILVMDLRFSTSTAAVALSIATFALSAVQLLLFQEARPLMPALKSWWLTSHVLTAVVAYGLLFASSVLALVGLAARKVPANLEGLMNRLVTIAFPFLTLLILTGAVWAEYAWGSFWRWDPKETWALITWLVYLAYLHQVNVRKWTGRKALWSALACFMIVIFTFYGVNLLLSGLHSYA